MALMGAAVALTVAWVWLARRSFFYLLPAYFVAVAVDAPFTPTVIAYPDLGFGGLTESLIKVGDVLLVATVLLSRSARKEWRRPLPASLAGLSALALTIAWIAGDFPWGAMLLLGTVPLRLALLLAVFSAASLRGDARAFARSGVATILLFGVPVGLLLASMIAPGIGAFTRGVGMATTDGRIAFVGLGNNKIGLSLTLIVAALIIHRRPSGARGVPLWIIAVAALFAAASSLRFATTGLLLLALAAALTRSRLSAGLALIGAAFGLAVAWFALDDTVTARSLSVVSGEFDASSDSSLRSRWRIWGAAFDIWRGSPLFGRLGGWEWERVVPSGVLRSPIETHSEFLWWMTSFGVLGLAILLCVLWPPVKTAARGGALPLLAMGLVLASLTLNAAAYFPAAAACLAFVFSAARFEPKLQGSGPQDREVVGAGA